MLIFPVSPLKSSTTAETRSWWRARNTSPARWVKTLVTDDQGKASTSDDLLPTGEYILHESATNESMLLTAPDQTVLVEDDGIIYEFTMADEVVRGGRLD